MKKIGHINGWFPNRAFGFVHENQNGILVRYFLHCSNILSGTPRDGATVRFNVGKNSKGLTATDVEIESASVDGAMSALTGDGRAR